MQLTSHVRFTMLVSGRPSLNRGISPYIGQLPNPPVLIPPIGMLAAAARVDLIYSQLPLATQARYHRFRRASHVVKAWARQSHTPVRGPSRKRSVTGPGSEGERGP